MRILSLIISLVLVKQCPAVIYSVNETEYQRMPSLFAMDDYAQCMLQPGGIYCMADYELSSRNHSALMHFIREYSANEIKHFNHTQIHRATCVTITCKDHLHKTNKTADLKDVLGACVNESIWRSHKLEASLYELQYCKNADERPSYDTSDFIVAAIYVIVIMINVIGSFYDIILCKKDSKAGNAFLLAFSMRRNWAKLVAPGGSGPEPRMERLKMFNGLRVITLGCVIFSHCALSMAWTYIANPHYLEMSYDDLSKQTLYNGNMVTCTFLLMSSFLLSYNLQMQAEKTKISWTFIPKGILLRWIRLTPPYALVLASVSTWMRYLGSGPLWDTVVVSEANSCRQYWWANVLYFNNYMFEQDRCFPQAWYLATDTQLFCVSLILLVMVQKSQHRKVALTLLFLVSLVITAAHTYIQDLDVISIISPEACRSVFIHSDTFKLVYVRGHTNLSTYILGLAGGLVAYHWQTSEKDMTKYKKYSWIIWLMFPMGLAIILSGGFFYMDGATPPALLRALYAALFKPVFQFLVLSVIISCIFKIESVYRGIIEWRGFSWAGRVSYSAFLLHSVFQRGFVGIQTTSVILNDYYLIIQLLAAVSLSFGLGAVLWLLVEAPLAGVVRAALAPRPKPST